MLEERATVLSVDGPAVWVEADRSQGCAKCEAGEGCGGGMLTKLVKRNNSRVLVLNNLADVSVGDEVIVGFDEKALLKSSMMAYLLPLIAMFAAAIFAEYAMAANDLIVAAMGMLGLVSGFMGLHYFGRRTADNRDYQPVVLRHAAKSSTGCQVYIANSTH